eukprot:CAMPEP_0170458228 /NCGR_PEP_ID=MMETSP0123-20130129/5256_1 /TAXON_ID=182087 /ORGANISM="Favella ehrenbergii, Strain Fehren 1" /LENGTH=100 /DNA_ID=CAMNT_0010722283 /DNA_START=508 /DNA_END=810 /DNA_ORIENTATION=-
MAIFISGFDSSYNRSSCEWYDVARQRWNRAPGLNVVRGHHSSTALGSRVYAFFGQTTNGSKLDSIETLNALDHINGKNTSWELIANDGWKATPRDYPLST